MRKLPMILIVTAFGLYACFRCPEAEYGNLRASVPTPEKKNEGLDLKGWTYEKIVSEKSNETHYYYQYPSDDPTKPTLVLLHGIIFDGKNFLEFKPLSKHFNLIAYDLPGSSSFYRGGMDDFSAALNDFFHAKQLSSIYLGGVSLGGQIAMIYASDRQPVSLKGLVLISTDIAKSKRELRKSRRIARTTARITDREADKTFCVVTKLVERKKKEETDNKRTLDNFVLRPVDFYNQALDISLDMKTLVPLQSIDVPTLIVHGDRDSVVSIDDARGLESHIPDATFVVIEGGGHAIAYSHAATIVQHIESRFSQKRTTD